MLENGTTVYSKDVVSQPTKGRKLVLLGDTSNPSSIINLGKNCDLLVHETTLRNVEMRKAISRGHSTPKMAGKIGYNMKAKNMIITHFGGRASKEKLIKQLVSETKAYLLLIINY